LKSNPPELSTKFTSKTFCLNEKTESLTGKLGFSLKGERMLNSTRGMAGE
jgi:hypothetical protein